MQLKESVVTASPFAKPAASQHEIHHLLRNRWSPRAFAATPVSEQDLKRLFEAARWSPSANNQQPWAFVVAQKDDPERFAKVAGLLNDRNSRWATRAPVLAIAALNKNNASGAPNAWAAYDLGQAVAHLSIQAQALGLAVHQMAGFDRVGAHEALGIPEDYEAMTAIAIGYQGEIDALPEDLRERETAPRTRKPLEAFVFKGEWNNPLD